jgi:N-acyl-D-amino-acid deacylase
MGFDLLLTNGKVYDGLGNPPRPVDVGITGDTISAIGELRKAEAARVLDLAGLTLCPGFIDVHSHSDAYALVEPSAASKITQGITTEVVGNCGASAAPLHGEYRMPSDWRSHSFPGSWSTVAEYRALLDQTRPAVNMAMLIGHNTLRAGVVGYEGRAATAEEQKTMEQRLAQSLEEGACGLSTGLIYIPGVFAPREEVAALCRVVAAYDGIYTSHMRSESSALLEAIDETLDYGRQSGARVQISHLKTSGRSNWHKIDDALQKIRDARAEGLDVCADRYPYTAACTDLDVILPDWALDDGHAAILARVRDPETRKRLHDELLEARGDAYWETVHVGSTHHPDNARFKGMPLCDVARVLGVEPVDAMLYMVDTDELKTTGIFFGMSEDNMWRILGEPNVMLGSDGSIHAPHGPLSHDHPHPRAYGSFPRYLRAVLDGKTVPLAEAIRKMTSLCASHFGFPDRGVLAQGYRADLVAFAPDEVQDHATFAEPHHCSTGMRLVIVNGVVTIENGKETGQRGGRFVSNRHSA